MRAVSLRIAQKWWSVCTLDSTTTPQNQDKRRDKSIISPCQRSLPLRGRTCVFCVILVGKVKAHISLSLVYYVGLIGGCMLFHH